MKILFIESGTIGGGSFESLYQTVKLLKINHYEVYIICFNKTGYNKKWENLGATVFQLNDYILSVKNRNGFFRFIRFLYKVLLQKDLISLRLVLRIFHQKSLKDITWIIKTNKISNIYLNNQIQRDIGFLLLKKKLNTKIISHLRSTRPKHFSKSMADYSNSIVDVFISNSKYCLEFWLSSGIKRNKMVLLKNFIEIPEKPLTKSFCKINENFRVGVLANYSSEKGYSFLFKTIQNILDINKSFKFVIGGTGVEENFELKKYKIPKENITFLGYVKNKNKFFQKIDVLVVPSKKETFGRVILEAGLYHIPVIASKVGGIPEVIINDETGILVEYGDINSLKNGLLKLKNDLRYSQRLANKAYLRINNKFSAKLFANRMEFIIKEFYN